MSVHLEIFTIFQHKVEWILHFARVTEVRHIYLSNYFTKFFYRIFLANICDGLAGVTHEYFPGIFVTVTVSPASHNIHSSGQHSTVKPLVTRRFYLRGLIGAILQCLSLKLWIFWHFFVQKGHLTWMLITSSGGDPVPECLSAKRSPCLNLDYCYHCRDTCLNI